MLSHNSYFDGQVQSVAFERLGRKQSVGVFAPGEHTLGTDAPERMTVVSGEFLVKREGDDSFAAYPAGTYFEIRGKSSFQVKVAEPTAYLCEYF